MRHHCTLAGLAILLATAGDDRGREEAAEADRACVAELARWHLTTDGVTLDQPKSPVLRWTNPSAGRVYGNTYIWLLQGRPTVVSSLYRFYEPFQSFDGELAALTGAKLIAKRDDKVLWQPKEEWKWHAVSGAAAPAASAPQRLTQMRALAGEFMVEVLDTRNLPKGEDQTPRLLPKPLYRYDAGLTKKLDGALFAFVLGTDPELLLLLECDPTAARPEWRFGIARMNRDAIRVLRKGEKVWEAPFLKDSGLEDAYRFFVVGLEGKDGMR